MTVDEMEAIILAFPGATKGSSYGKPSFLVNGKFFTRLRKEDQSVVLSGIHHDEREMLMEAEPETFHITAHYKDYPNVLARIATVHPGSFHNFLERRWRELVPKKVAKEWDAAKS